MVKVVVDGRQTSCWLPYGTVRRASEHVGRACPFCMLKLLHIEASKLMQEIIVLFVQARTVCLRVLCDEEECEASFCELHCMEGAVITIYGLILVMY